MLPVWPFPTLACKLHSEFAAGAEGARTDEEEATEDVSGAIVVENAIDEMPTVSDTVAVPVGLVYAAETPVEPASGKRLELVGTASDTALGKTLDGSWSFADREEVDGNTI